MRWLAALLPTALFVFAVVSSRLSGNDKAPWGVLGVLALNLFATLILIVLAAFRRHERRTAWAQAAVAAAPLIYSMLAILAAHYGLVDLEKWVGFS